MESRSRGNLLIRKHEQRLGRLRCAVIGLISDNADDGVRFQRGPSACAAEIQLLTQGSFAGEYAFAPDALADNPAVAWKCPVP